MGIGSHGIGDFIHYRIADYGEYGINDPKSGKGKSGSPNFTTIKENIVKRVKQSYDKKKLQQIENTFNEIMYGEGIKEGEAKKKWEHSIQIFEKNFINYVNEKYSQKLRVFDTIDSLRHLTMKNDSGIVKNLSEKDSSPQDEIEKLIKQLDALSEGVSEQHVNSDSINNNLNKIKEIQNKLQSKFKLWKSEHPNDSTDIEFDADLKKLLKSAYEFVRLDSVPGKTIMQGFIFEAFMDYMINLGGEVIFGKVNEVQNNVVDFLTNLSYKGPSLSISKITGGDTSKTQIPVKNISKKLLESEEGEILLEGNLRPTQDKADVVLKLSDNENIGFSLKNYKMRWNKGGMGTIHILSKSPFYNLFMNSDPILANHWLNLVSKTQQTSDPEAPPPDTTSEYSQFNSERNQARSAMRLSILYQAATGNLEGRQNPAEILVVNDLTTKKVRFISIKELLNSIIEKEKRSKTVDDFNSVNGLEIKGLPKNSVMEEWYLNDSQRIIKLLSQLRQYKISASVKLNKNSIK